MSEINGSRSWREELASLVEDTGLRYTAGSFESKRSEFTIAGDSPEGESESLKDQVQGFLKAWGEMAMELGRGCRDIVQQSLVTQDSFIVQKLGGPCSEPQNPSYNSVPSPDSRVSQTHQSGEDQGRENFISTPKMVNYMLMITAELENLTNLQPQGGCDDPDFTYYFKVKCGNCGELSQKDTTVTLSETVPLPKSKGTTHLVQKCKFCDREGTILMVPGRGRPLTQEMSESGRFTPLMLLDCRGFEPVEFSFRAGWKAESRNLLNMMRRESAQ